MTKLLHSSAVWWFFLGLTVFIYFYALNIPLLGPDEPRYAQVAREMFERGDWVTPTLGGHHWFEKPSLLYWLQIVAYHTFGVSEFAARFGSALFGLGTIACLWIVGRFSANEDRGSEFANWLALAGAASIGLLVFARGASFDIIVTFPIAASLTGFYVFLRTRDKRHETVGLFAFYFFAGLAVLAKGLIGVLFPFAIVGFYFLLSRNLPQKQLLLSLFWGPVVMFAVAAVWNLPMYLRHGWGFIDEFYIQHHFQRYTSNKYKHPQPFYFFWWVLPLMTFPWIPFFFPGVWRTVKELFHRGDVEPSDFRELRLFGLAWLLVPLVFFSVSGSKLPGYILPALPGALIVAATYIFEFTKISGSRRVLVFAIALAVFAVNIGLLTFILPRYADSDSIRRLIQTADSNGYAQSRIANFATLSHNAEFYAAGRLIRNEDGTQITFYDPSKLIEERSKTREPLLVLVPLTQIDALKIENQKRIADNGVLAIIAIGESN